MGARASIIIALVATALKLIVGTLYGAAMAHFGGWIDDVMMRIIEVINFSAKSFDHHFDHDGSWQQFVCSSRCT